MDRLVEVPTFRNVDTMKMKYGHYRLLILHTVPITIGKLRELYVDYQINIEYIVSGDKVYQRHTI